MSNLVKASHSPSELRYSALEHAWVHALSVPIYTDGSKSVPLFFVTLTYSSLPVVSSIFTVELFPIFRTLSNISFHDSYNFAIYCDSRSALQALGSLYTRNSLVLKIQRFLCDIHARRKFVSCWMPSHVGLSGNEKADVLSKRAIQFPHPIIMLYPFRTTFPLFAVLSVPHGSPVGTSVLRMAITWIS